MKTISFDVSDEDYENLNRFCNAAQITISKFFEYYIWGLGCEYFYDMELFFETFVEDEGLLTIIYAEKKDAEAAAEAVNRTISSDPKRQRYVKPYSEKGKKGFVITS